MSNRMQNSDVLAFASLQNRNLTSPQADESRSSIPNYSIPRYQIDPSGSISVSKEPLQDAPTPQNSTANSSYTRDQAESDIKKEHDRYQIAKFTYRSDGQSDRSTADYLSKTWRVVRIVDGDTLILRDYLSTKEETVRLLNINTPEKGEPGYSEASEFLRKTIGNSIVQLEFESSPAPTRDVYGRLLAFGFVYGKLVNYEVIRNGHSAFYTQFGEGRYAKPLEFAQQEWERRVKTQSR